MLLVNDRPLLEGFRRGDSWALAKVYRAYAPSIVTLLRLGFSFESQGRRCRFQGTRSAFDLEDRLQEVFARAFTERARQTYDGLSPYRAYLLRIARNLVIDDFRKKERALLEYAYEPVDRPASDPGGGLTEPFEGEVGTTGQPEIDLSGRQTVELVAAFCASMPLREQRVIQLRFREELEHQEVARQTGLSSSQIKTSELRIRRDFFRFMKKHGYFDGYRLNRRGWLRSLKGALENPR